MKIDVATHVILADIADRNIAYQLGDSISISPFYLLTYAFMGTLAITLPSFVQTKNVCLLYSLQSPPAWSGFFGNI